jgi:hypothetical protein
MRVRVILRAAQQLTGFVRFRGELRQVDGKPVVLADIRVPSLCREHFALQKFAYKLK